MLLWNISMLELRNPRLRRSERRRLNYWKSGFKLMLLLFGMSGAQTAPAAGVEEKSGLSLVASTSFIGELCETLAGDDAHIRVLMSRGVNPHSYQPSPGDLAAIEDADLVFVNGLGLEHQLRNVLPDDVRLIDISKDVDALTAHDDHDDEHGGFNPHLWFSPRNMMAAIRIMRDSLSNVDPENNEIYRAREEEYSQRLGLLDARIREATMELDEESRRLVTDHPFMDYYARDYDFEIVGHIVDSISDQAEPSALEISKLVNLLREEDIGAIFIGDSAGRAMKSLAETVVVESGRNIRIVELLSGSLAPIGRRGSNYFDFIIYNTELIVEAIGGE